MPRKPRCYLPGVPAHIVQRGNNRQPCFFAARDYVVYREALADGLQRYGAQLHAYVLMTNHVHLLITPEHPDSLSRVMQHVGRQYVGYVNAAYRRTGTLWEGRHKASIIDAERYLLACCRYIELNPVRAGMVSDPADYEWSSYRHHALGVPDDLVTPHPLFMEMGVDVGQRQCVWRALVAEGVGRPVVDEIRKSLTHDFPLGDGKFRERIEGELQRSVGRLDRGRPSIKEKGSE